MKQLQNKFFKLLFMILFSAVFIFGYGSYACDSECEMSSVECKCDVIDVCTGNDGLNISSQCSQILDNELLPIVFSEQKYQRVLNVFAYSKSITDKTGLSDISLDNPYKKFFWFYKSDYNSVQDIILKTSQLII